MSISYQRVRTALKSNRLAKSQKDKDVHKSIKYWVKHIQNAKGKAFFDSALTTHADDFLLGWCTSFQLEVRKESMLPMYTVIMVILKANFPLSISLLTRLSLTIMTFFAWTPLTRL
jgi:hypothetical protein